MLPPGVSWVGSSTVKPFSSSGGVTNKFIPREVGRTLVWSNVAVHQRKTLRRTFAVLLRVDKPLPPGVTSVTLTSYLSKTGVAVPTCPLYAEPVTRPVVTWGWKKTSQGTWGSTPLNRTSISVAKAIQGAWGAA